MAAGFESPEKAVVSWKPAGGAAAAGCAQANIAETTAATAITHRSGLSSSRDPPEPNRFSLTPYS
jgi:hypothetical protein